MKKYVITTGTVTYAIKGRDLLRNPGYNVNIARIASGASTGCGYSRILNGELEEAESILRNAGI